MVIRPEAIANFSEIVRRLGDRSRIAGRSGPRDRLSAQRLALGEARPEIGDLGEQAQCLGDGRVVAAGGGDCLALREPVDGLAELFWSFAPAPDRPAPPDSGWAPHPRSGSAGPSVCPVAGQAFRTSLRLTNSSRA